MATDEKFDKFRLAPRETIEEMMHRFERQHRAENLQRESNLENSVSPYRIGSVPYLNAVPLTRGIEDQIIFDTPARLAKMLQNKELDAALVSIIEVLTNDIYNVLDGIAIASLNEVKSVHLAHRRPLEEIDVVYCDVASLTSVALLQVLLAERGLFPQIKQIEDYTKAADCDYVMLIGDQALNFLFENNPHQIWDLGSAWYDLTRLPFVYAVWAIRKDTHNKERLIQILREAKDFGMDTLDYIISSRGEYTYDFRRDYLSWHIHYHIGEDERRGIEKFMDLLKKHKIVENVYPPQYVA